MRCNHIILVHNRTWYLHCIHWECSYLLAFRTFPMPENFPYHAVLDIILDKNIHIKILCQNSITNFIEKQCLFLIKRQSWHQEHISLDKYRRLVNIRHIYFNTTSTSQSDHIIQPFTRYFLHYFNLIHIHCSPITHQFPTMWTNHIQIIL